MGAQASTDGERKRRGPFAYLTAKLGRVGAMLAVGLVITALAGVAIAAVFARAELSGDVTSGTAALEFVDVGSPGFLIEQAVYDPDGTTIGGTEPLAAHVTAMATVDGAGNLVLDVDGLFSGEGINIQGLDLLNASSLALTTFAWDYNGGQFGADGSGQTYEIWLAEWNGAAFAPVDPATFGTIAAGAFADGANGYMLIVEMPAASIADGTPHSLTGVGIVGNS